MRDGRITLNKIYIVEYKYIYKIRDKIPMF